MILSFKNRGTENIFNGQDTRQARKTCPHAIWSVARRKLVMVHTAPSLRTLAALPGNALEALKGGRKGQHSVRINDQYRICFRWQEDGAGDVEIVDYH